MASKARFTQQASTGSSGTSNVPTPKGTRVSVGASGAAAGSKRTTAKDQTSGNGTATAPGASTKSGRVQVIFNGKIATPQSLIPRKTTDKDHAKKLRAAAALKPVQTIDETGSENADRMTTGLTTKLSSKRADPSSESRLGGSKFSMAFKPKVVVEETVTVLLAECPTSILFHLPSHIVASDTRDVIHTEERNAKYENVIKSHKNVDGFASRPSQTKNHQLKNQNDMAAPNPSREVGNQAISYEIKDETSTATVETEMTTVLISDPAEDSGFTAAVSKFVKDTVSVALVTPGCLLDTVSAVKPPPPGEGRESKARVANNKRSMMSMKHMSEAPSDDEGLGGAGTHNSSHHPQGHPSQSGVSQSGMDSNMDSDDGQPAYAAFTEEDSAEVLREAEVSAVLSSPLLLKRLHMIERAIQQNANYRQQLDYRDLPDISPLQLIKDNAVKEEAFTPGLNKGMTKRAFTDRNKSVSYGAHGTLSSDVSGHLDTMSVHSMDDNKPAAAVGDGQKIKKLFTFSTALIKDLSVTCMAWNSSSTDLLAVGYGKTSDSKHANENGIVLFWSLRNPDYPEKILTTGAYVTCLEFSKQHPMLLAVGLVNGDVNIYDVKREGWATPIESSVGMAGGHLYPVWQVQWVTRGVERLETLVTISTDGKVLEWNLKKGLVVSCLMQLKKSGTGEGWISNASAGMCFDFHPSDPSTYITGTEDGSLYKCSISYNEQYLETYAPHEGPVYKISFSPRWEDVFLTVSADWLIHLYHLSSKTPLLTMRATGESAPIVDCSWAPHNSTVFATVSADARLQIWDLSVSCIDPVISLDVADAEDVEEVVVKPEETGGYPNSPPPTAPGTAPGTGGAPGNGSATGSMAVKPEDTAPVARLLKALSVPAKRRCLTSVLFGSATPVVVVGDDRGAVHVYRVFDPLLITLLGPVQQHDKLKTAVIKQTDPAHAALLEADGGGARGSTAAGGAGAGGGAGPAVQEEKTM